MSEHITKIVPNVTVGATEFKLRVICSCQFEALAKTEEQAAYYERSHLFRHGKLNNGG